MNHKGKKGEEKRGKTFSYPQLEFFHIAKNIFNLKINLWD
jgi:hypothetical protein